MLYSKPVFWFADGHLAYAINDAIWRNLVEPSLSVLRSRRTLGHKGLPKHVKWWTRPTTSLLIISSGAYAAQP